MRTLFCHDTYYNEAPDRNVYSTGVFPYTLWKDRFLLYSNHVQIIGRKGQYDSLIDDSLPLSSGKNVGFTLIENINSPFKRLFSSGNAYKIIRQEVEKADLVVIRGPVEFGMMAAKAARQTKTPYVVEMSGCAFDHTWYHGSLIGKLYAPFKYLRARHMVSKATGAIYVTQYFLQRRYPPPAKTSHASNVELPKPPQKVLTVRLKKITKARPPLKFGLIGNYGNHLKGLPVALKAFASIQDEIPDFRLHILGQGDPETWRSLIEKYGLKDSIVFDGTREAGQGVLDWLDDIDIYIQPSFHEGLPRALIEAMSRSCPALASTAGGTDELLDQKYIHKKGDAKTLARQLKMLCTEADLSQLAEENFKTAQNYTKEVLNKRRHAFWSDIYSKAEKRSA